jgi:hypothetical protein
LTLLKRLKIWTWKIESGIIKQTADAREKAYLVEAKRNDSSFRLERLGMITIAVHAARTVREKHGLLPCVRRARNPRPHTDPGKPLLT